MFEAYLTAYPWDLAPGDLEGTLDRLHGEIGVSGLSIWGASGPLVMVRPPGAEHRIVLTDGGLLFRTELQNVSESDKEALDANWMGDRASMTQIGEACAQSGLKIRWRLPATVLSRLARRHPEMASRNAFGAYSRRTLCLVNPTVRSLLSALAESFCKPNHQTALVWNGVWTAWSEAFVPELITGPEPGKDARAFLSVCFCDSCLDGAHQAGVDATAAREQVRSNWDLAAGTTDASDSPVRSADGAIQQFLQWRNTQLIELVAGFRATCPCPHFVERSPEDPGVLEPVAWENTDQVEVIRHVESDEQLHLVLDSQRGCQNLRLGSALTLRSSGDSLISNVQGAMDRGVRTFEFDGYGFLSEVNLDVVRRAIRYARRSSGT